MRDSCFGSQCASFFLRTNSPHVRDSSTHTRTRFNVLQFAYTTKPSPRSLPLCSSKPHTRPRRARVRRPHGQPTAAAVGLSPPRSTVAQYTPPRVAALSTQRNITHKATKHSKPQRPERSAPPLFSLPRRPQILKPRTSLSQWCHCASVSSGPASGTCPPTPRPRHGGPSAWRSPPRP